MKENKIVKKDSKHLPLTKNNFEIIRQILHSSVENSAEYGLLKKICQLRPQFIKAIISLHYPFCKDEISECSSLLDWRRISGNQNIKWSEELINRFNNLLIFKGIGFSLSKNKMIPFSESLIYKFADRLDWGFLGDLSKNTSFKISFPLLFKLKQENIISQETFNDWCKRINLDDLTIFKYQNEFNWDYISQNDHIYWTEELVGEFKDKLRWDLLLMNSSFNWSDQLLRKELSQGWRGRYFYLERLCMNKGVIWGEEILKSYKDVVIWRLILKYNSSIEWTIRNIECFSDSRDWSWDAFSKSTNVEWSVKILRTFEHRLNWSLISSNETIPWSKELIKMFDDKWSWTRLSQNEALPWSEELINNYSDKWLWGGTDEYLTKTRIVNTYDSFFDRKEKRGGLSENRSLPWSESFIEDYADKWNWKILSRNTGVLFSESFIMKFEDRWDWQLLYSNSSALWSLEFLTTCIDAYASERGNKSTRDFSSLHLNDQIYTLLFRNLEFRHVKQLLIDSNKINE